MPNSSSQSHHPFLVALGTALRRKRIERGISQEELAFRAQIDRSYLGRIERGENNVTVLTLTRLANSLDMSLPELLDLKQD